MKPVTQHLFLSDEIGTNFGRNSKQLKVLNFLFKIFNRLTFAERNQHTRNKLNISGIQTTYFCSTCIFEKCMHYSISNKWTAKKNIFMIQNAVIYTDLSVNQQLRKHFNTVIVNCEL